jgi:hypothetical protein
MCKGVKLPFKKRLDQKLRKNVGSKTYKKIVYV